MTELQHSTGDNFELHMVEAAIDSTVNAIIIIDEAGCIKRVNPATEEIFGFLQAEMLGKNVSMLMPAPHQIEHDGYIRNYLDNGQRRIIGIGREVEGRRKDGSCFPIHLSVGEFTADGKHFFVGTIHDITARKAAEHESSRQRTLFEAIFDNCPDAMIIANANGEITLCNPAANRIFEFSIGEALGKTMHALFANHVEYDRFVETASAEMPEGAPGGNFITLRRASGKDFPAITATANIISSEGANIGFLVVIRDVSREVAQDQALRQVQRMEALGQLTGGIAHDFNNLLTIITGNLELLDLDIEDEKQRDFLKRANDAALMGARLTDRLLTFARRRPLDATLINLNEQLLGMMDMLRRALGETINLASSLAPDLWSVRSDVSEIENAVLNLAINARDAMPSGGQLLVETSNLVIDDPQVSEEVGLGPGHYIRLSVSDSGHGIAPDTLSRVFDPFFTTKEGGRGTGLGLSVIYGFARQSGGKVTIYSEVAHGTTVNLYLPRADADFKSEDKTKASKVPASASGEIVLVVEDQDPVREVTMKRLVQLGYLVVEADSGVTAIALLQGGAEIDLVFSDVVMPGGVNGFELAEWLRENRPNTPVILTSGFAENIANGFNEANAEIMILRKPYSGDDLARAIRSALHNK